MTDSFPTPERREMTAIEVRKLSNGARTGLISVLVLLLVNAITLIVYIVKDHERQTMLENTVTDHLEWAEEFRRDVIEMKLDIRELTVRSELAGNDLVEHRETEP